MQTKQIKKLDELWRKEVKARDKQCVVCGSDSYLNSHHVIGRRNRTLRWDMFNGVLLCSGCHTFKTESAHQDPAWFMDWFMNSYPERYDWLMNHRQEVLKRTYEDVLEDNGWN